MLILDLWVGLETYKASASRNAPVGSNRFFVEQHLMSPPSALRQKCIKEVGLTWLEKLQAFNGNLMLLE